MDRDTPGREVGGSKVVADFKSQGKEFTVLSCAHRSFTRRQSAMPIRSNKSQGGQTSPTFAKIQFLHKIMQTMLKFTKKVIRKNSLPTDAHMNLKTTFL